MAEAASGAPPLDLCVVRPTLGQGGADRVTVTLLRHLDRRRFRPRLVLMRRAGELLAEVPDDVEIDDLDGHSLWTAWWPLARRLRRRPPQILYSTSSGANLIAAIAWRLSGRRSRLVLSERTPPSRSRRRGLKHRLQLVLKRWLYPRADCVTAVSKGVAGELISRLGVPAERVRVVYNPVVTPEIDELARAEVEHPWFGGDEPVLLGVGRLIPAKRFDLLIDLLPRIRAARPPRLAILGEGPERRPLERRVAELGLQERVWLPGFEANPFRFMSRCTLFVLCSRHEGLPGALIQAMACGAAVVATDCDHGPAEIVEDGVDGLLVPVDDPGALVAGIERLLDDDGLRQRFGRSGRETARRFSLAAVLGDQVEALLGGGPEERETA